ncbi:hypothetical protein MC64_014120 [Aeromonas caviae]|nr:hypothetical protein MC64_014120 [Aeromonas caviae]
MTLAVVALFCDCRLPTADCRLPTADCRLPTADCRLPTADCRLAPFHRTSSLIPTVYGWLKNHLVCHQTRGVQVHLSPRSSGGDGSRVVQELGRGGQICGRLGLQKHK